MTKEEVKATQESGRPMLKAENLSVYYDKVRVLDKIDLVVQEKEIVCLIGSNGAGKTTFLRAVSGLAPIASGECHFAGINLRSLSAHKIARLGISHIPQGRQIIPDLTVKENLELGSYRIHRNNRDKVRRLMEQEFDRFPILRQRQDQVAVSLSGGEQQMLAISRALMMEPRFVIMDEPSLGLAPLVVEEIIKAIWRLNRSGMTVLLVEQAATLALAIAHRGYVLQNGQIIVQGPAKDLRENPDVIKGYLGEY
jgi:branched-chain amino acid transport system ATP-binding protein